MGAKIEKPLSVRRRECMDAVCAAINAAELPACVIMEIMDRVAAEAKRLAETEYRQDMARYKAALKDKKSETEGKLNDNS